MIIAISGKKQSGKDTVAKIIQYLTRKLEGDHFSTVHWDERVLNMMPNSDWDNVWTWETHRFAHELKVFISNITGISLEDLEKEEVKNQLMGEEWIRYWYADGFYDDHKGQRTMNAAPCDKEMYEIQRRINWQTAYKHHPTVREMLTGIGTDALRKWHPNIWVNATFAKYKESFEYNPAYDDKGIYDVDEAFEISNPPMFPKWIIPDMRFPNELEAVEKYGGITIRVDRDGIPQGDHISETALDDAAFKYRIVNDGTLQELVDKVELILKEEKII